VKSAPEALVGLSLLVLPAMVVSLLVGQQLAEPAGVAIARVAGVALLALGISCWLARNDIQSRAARGLVVALLLYDVSIVLILLSARFRAGLSGIGIWPTVVLHSGLGFWSFLCLKKANQWAVEG
jgi:hypothetical protein